MRKPAVEPLEFHIWGCRGSHNIVPSRSGVGNSTSCYSVLSGDDLLVFDAGRGLQMLGYVTNAHPRFKRVKTVHVFVTHAHADHWEGLKDVDWFWRRGNNLHVTIYGTEQALRSIKQGFAHPSYVPLEILSRGTVSAVRMRRLRAGDRRQLGPFTVGTFPLNHYSSDGRGKRRLDTIGYSLTAPGGPRIAYLSDHEPTKATRATEEAALQGTHLAVYDAHYRHQHEHMYGHGSQQHASEMARNHPRTIVLAGHIGPMFTDKEILEAHRRYSHGISNFSLAIEGARYRWSPSSGRFERVADSWLR